MRIIESMTKISVTAGVHVRVWRNEESVQSEYDNSDLIDAVKENSDKDLNHIAEILSMMPRVNAVEALNDSGNGVLIYPSWP